MQRRLGRRHALRFDLHQDILPATGVIWLNRRRLAMTTAATHTVKCPQCSDRIIAPELSEYVCERAVRHLWRCSKCNYRFETTVAFDVEPPLAPDLVERFLPSLVIS